MPRYALPTDERNRDWVVRCAVRCDACGAPAFRRCRWPADGMQFSYSHTARYDAAAALGVVAPIPPSPGRNAPMDTGYQPIPPGEWVRLRDAPAEVYQDTGAPQSVAVAGGRLRWLNFAHFPQPTKILLRPPGGAYPAGWAPMIVGTWWVSEVPEQRKAS